MPVNGDFNGLLNRVTQGDAIEVLRQLPSESVDLVLCDPPFGMTDCRWDKTLPFADLWHELGRVLKPHAAAVLCASGRFTSRLIESSGALPYRHRWFWDRGRVSNVLNANRMPLRQIEELVVLAQRSTKYHPQKTPCTPRRKHGHSTLSPVWRRACKPRHRRTVTERFPTDLLRLERGIAADRDRIHPTQKPLELGRYMVRTYSDPGDVVLDFAAGAGTFPVAALSKGRNFVGIELNDDVRTIKADSALTDLCRATCTEVRRIDHRRAEYRVDCVAFAKGRAEKAWRDLASDKRGHVCRVGWIAEFEGAASEAQA